jgi:hypothetical protein
MFNHNLITPVLGIDRDLDDSTRRLTRLILVALDRFARDRKQGATRAQLQAELNDSDAQALVSTVLAEALHDELVDVDEPTRADATWTLNHRGLERLSRAQAKDESKRRVGSGSALPTTGDPGRTEAGT